MSADRGVRRTRQKALTLPRFGSCPLDLSDEQKRALAELMKRTIEADRYPLSPRVRALQAILDKVEPPPVRETVPPPKVCAPPRGGRRRPLRTESGGPPVDFASRQCKFRYFLSFSADFFAGCERA
jgi:hypothetical protein